MRNRAVTLLLCVVFLCLVPMAAWASEDRAIGVLPLKQSPPYRSSQIAIRPQSEEKLVFFGYTRLSNDERFVVISAENDPCILEGEAGRLFLVPRASGVNAAPSLADWNAFICDWSRVEAMAVDWEPKAVAPLSGAQIGTEGIVLESAMLSADGVTGRVSGDGHYFAVREEGSWVATGSVALHVGRVTGEERTGDEAAAYAVLPATALTPLAKRVKNIAYKTDTAAHVTQNGTYLVVGITESGMLLYDTVRVTNVQ